MCYLEASWACFQIVTQWAASSKASLAFQYINQICQFTKPHQKHGVKTVSIVYNQYEVDGIFMFRLGLITFPFLILKE